MGLNRNNRTELQESIHWTVESTHFGPARLRVAGDGNDGGLMEGNDREADASNKELGNVRRIIVCTGVIVLRRQADQHQLEKMSTPLVTS